MKRCYPGKDDDPPIKKRKMESSTDSDYLREDISENKGFQRLLKRQAKIVWVTHKKGFERKLQEYNANGMKKGMAQYIVKQQMIKKEKEEFFIMYARIVQYILDWNQNPVHQMIIKHVEGLKNKGYKRPVNATIKQYEYLFTPLFENGNEDGDSEDSENKEDTDEESDSTAQESIGGEFSESPDESESTDAGNE